MYPTPHDILREAFRVLRAGGALRTTVPFHFVEHGCPKDYLRFTGQFFEDVCTDIGFTDIKTDTRSTSGMLYTIHQLSKAALVNRDAPDAGPARRAHVAIMSILGVCQALDSSFVGGGASHWHSTDMIAVKPGNYVAPDHAPDRSKHFLDRHDHILACPLTGDPLIRQGETLVTRRGASYKIVNGVPDMVMMQGQSSFSTIAKRLHDLQRKQHDPMLSRPKQFLRRIVRSLKTKTAQPLRDIESLKDRLRNDHQPTQRDELPTGSRGIATTAGMRAAGRASRRELDR